MSAVLFEADPVGSGSRSTGPGVVCSDMADWRRFGRALDFFGQKMNGVIAKTTGCPMTRKDSGMGPVSYTHLTLPTTPYV